MQQILDNLKIWRDKLYAHLDNQAVLSGTNIREEYPIEFGEIEALIQKSIEIVNGYGVAFDMIDRAIGLPIGNLEWSVFEPLRRDRAAQRNKLAL